MNDIFLTVVESGSADVARAQQRDGSWKIYGSADLYASVRALAASFDALGLRKGDRVLLVSENRVEWAITDFAALAIGLIDVPLFPTLKADQIGELANHSGARIAVVSTKAQLAKVLAVKDRTALEHIIVMDEAAAGENALSFAQLTTPAPQGRDAAFDARIRAIQPEDIASIIYTSGTTGEPKGVIMTHGNLGSNVSYSLREFPFEGPQRTVSFLPLSHSTARHADYALYSLGFSLAYCPTIDKLMPALQAVKPTLIVAVPRVLEKVRQEVMRKAQASAVSKFVVNWALGVGRRNERTILAGRTPSSPLWKLADKLFYTKVRAVFGGEVKFNIAGGAPLGVDNAHWFAAAGIRILEGYGLTETSPVIGVNTPSHYRLGSIGKPLPNIQTQIAPDGELLVKGPSVFSGYWQNPQLTAQAFDADGWFMTGDIGRIDEDGFLYITDRKKELLKTSAGKLIAPQPIEGKLKNDIFVGQAALVGDRQKYVATLISPNFDALEPWAKQQNIPFGSRSELVNHPLVQAHFKETIKEVNRTLADYELLKRFTVVPDEWTIDSGELTPSMKLKRRVLLDRYRDEIAAMFQS